MEIQFWYSDSIPTPGIQFVTENLYNTISFKNIDIDLNGKLVGDFQILRILIRISL